MCSLLLEGGGTGADLNELGEIVEVLFLVDLVVAVGNVVGKELSDEVNLVLGVVFHLLISFLGRLEHGRHVGE